MVKNNHYDTLRVAIDANQQTIRKAYKKLAQLYHPDKRENQKFAEHKFKELREAYQVLSDSEKRTEYDVEHGLTAENEDLKCLYVEGVSEIVDAACYRNGEKHGEWELRFSDGQVEVGSFVDGKRHGLWKLKFANGNVHKGHYANDKKHGLWQEKFSDGSVHSGYYVNDKEHGLWEEQSADGDFKKGHYVRGKKEGEWDEQFSEGMTEVGMYSKGKKHGFWKRTFADGTLKFCEYDMDEEKEVWETADSNNGGGSEDWLWLMCVIIFAAGAVAGGFLMSNRF